MKDGRSEQEPHFTIYTTPTHRLGYHSLAVLLTHVVFVNEFHYPLYGRMIGHISIHLIVLPLFVYNYAQTLLFRPDEIQAWPMSSFAGEKAPGNPVAAGRRARAIQTHDYKREPVKKKYRRKSDRNPETRKQRPSVYPRDERGCRRDAENRRVDLDGGPRAPTEVGLMSLVDGLELRASDSPAIVALEGGRTEIVTDHRIVKEGWLRVRDRGGVRRMFPPGMIEEVQLLETEIVEGDGGRRRKRIVEDCTPEMEFLAGATSA